MAKIPYQDPLSSEVQSPLIAGAIEGLSKVSETVGMNTKAAADCAMTPVYGQSEDDPLRIWQVTAGNRNWLSSPAPVIKLNGSTISANNYKFTTDYLGGSITFVGDYRPKESDKITASFTQVITGSTITQQIDNLDSRVSNIIADGQQTEGNTELIDIRVGADGKTYPTAGNAVREQVSSLKGDLDGLDNKFTTGKNLINVDELSALGEWCNYTTGIIESNSYVTNYRHTPFIKVEPNTYYSRRYSLGKNSSVVYFDNSKKYIGYSSTDIFQTPTKCAYVIVNIRDDIEPSSSVLMIKGNEVINIYPDIYPTPPYYEDFKYPNPNYIKDDGTLLKKADAESTYVKKTDADYVVVAKSGGDYTTVKEAFEYARSNDKYVIIKAGTYDLVEEGISGQGYLLPKKVIGYGARLVCNLGNEDWALSPLNVDWQYEEHEVYGLEIECSNCRYCIHDEKGARTSGKYRHVFKDLHLIHNSNSSSVLIAPNNIGGGIGNGGYIEIDNCVFEQNGGYNRNIDYHTSFTEHQDDSTIIKCTNSVFNKQITITGIGSDTSFMNKMYVSNCLCGTIPTSEIKTNIQMIAWNNVSM